VNKPGNADRDDESDQNAEAAVAARDSNSDANPDPKRNLNLKPKEGTSGRPPARGYWCGLRGHPRNCGWWVTSATGSRRVLEPSPRFFRERVRRVTPPGG